MPRKCCVAGLCQCTKLYQYRLPADTDECDRWVRSLPNTTRMVTKNIGVCEEHWPQGFPTVRKKGKNRPQNPPSVFKYVPNSFRAQTLVSPRRELNRRNIDYESRQTSNTKSIDNAITITDCQSL